jgi:hypothetical protein
MSKALLRWALVLLVSSSGLAMPAAAQDTTATSGLRRCDGLVIHAIEVDAQRPPFEGHSAQWRRAARAIGLHHITTDTVVVRRFLTLRAGGRCSNFRLRESERLLRAQPFLANASVRAVADSLGGVTVQVQTVDEIPVIGSVSISGTQLNALRLGNQNVFGRALLLEARGAREDLQGKSIGLHSTYYQFLKRPYLLDVAALAGERQHSWLIAASHPYYTDLQLIAWRTGVARTGRGFKVVTRGEDIPDLGLGYSSLNADVAGVLRLGGVQHPILVGGVAAIARRDPTENLSVGEDGAVVSDTALAGQYQSIRYARLLGVGAWRNLRYVTASGFDALTGTQDLANGVQLLGAFGKGLHVAGSSSDMFAYSDFFAGGGGPMTYAGMHVLAEGRHDQDKSSWDGVLVSGRAAYYWKHSPDNLLRMWVDGAGGWKVRVPFQLRPATDGTRIGGYRGSQVGARRVGGGVEYRRVLTGAPKRVDLGVSTFFNAAQLWAGDAPYGVDTPLLPTMGVGVLAAFPRGSKRLARVDLMMPLQRGVARSGFEVRFSLLNRTSIIRHESGDIKEAREGLVGADLFRP